jgi:hypothetical protein
MGCARGMMALMHHDLPNNPLKLPFFVVSIAVLGFLAIICASDGLWFLVVLLVAEMVSCLYSIRAIRRGRNPRWLRSPLDRWWERRSRS